MEIVIDDSPLVFNLSRGLLLVEFGPSNQRRTIPRRTMSECYI